MLCLHEWGAHEHPSLTSPDLATPGNGLLLFFRVDDFDASLARARALVGRFEEEPHVNPNTRTEEFSLRDPDGYYVTISALAPRERDGGRHIDALTSRAPFWTCAIDHVNRNGELTLGKSPLPTRAIAGRPTALPRECGSG